jgi:hypothetical protein
MNRAVALAELLRACDFVCEVEHDAVVLVAPKHTEARVFVGANVDDYLCSFTATSEHTTALLQHGNSKLARQWANWTASVREHVLQAWSSVEHLPTPPKWSPPPVLRGPVYEHTYPLFVPIEDGFVHAWQVASRERRFVVLQQWQDLDGNAGPALTWHAWGYDTAALLGASAGWNALDSLQMPATHPAAGHVRRILCEAAKTVEPPSGIVALDLRGLTLQTCEAIVQTLIEAARERQARGEWTRGAIVLCESITTLYLNRSVSLYIEP